ncbi:MAG: winged helix-turn-helix domain-containing protein [Halobaculum sp.]
MNGREPTDEEIREMTKKQARKQFPSGWMEVARYETLVLALDALLEAPATREFTVTELAEQAGTTAKSLRNRIDSLVELSIVEIVERNGETRYTLNDESPVVDQLYELNVTVQQVREDSTDQTQAESTETAGERSGVNSSDDTTDTVGTKFGFDEVRG